MDLRMNRALIFALALLPATPALAEHVYGPDFLKPDEIKSCLRDRAEVTRVNAELSARKDPLDAEGAEIEQNERALELQQAEIAVHRQELATLKESAEAKDVDLNEGLRRREAYKEAKARFSERLNRYNDGVRAQQEKRDPHNAAAVQLNSELDALQARANAVDARCAGKKTYADDQRAAEAALAAERDAPPHP
jgi:hypothetical protein